LIGNIKETTPSNYLLWGAESFNYRTRLNGPDNSATKRTHTKTSSADLYADALNIGRAMMRYTSTTVAESE
jgi:hypothetical protein